MPVLTPAYEHTRASTDASVSHTKVRTDERVRWYQAGAWKVVGASVFRRTGFGEKKFMPGARYYYYLIPVLREPGTDLVLGNGYLLCACYASPVLT